MPTAEQQFDLMLVSQNRRNYEWQKLRHRYLYNFDTCIVCGARKRLVAHHVKPYHLFKKLEMETTNLVTLCERCHLFVGHLSDYKSYNPNVHEDAELWRDKIRQRPNKMRYLRK